jgi:hypothetical protein
MVAAASLSSDMTKMVSVGGDGCVIVWKLPEQLVQEVQAAVKRVAAAKLHLDAAGQQQQQDQQAPGHVDGAASGRQMAWSASPAAASANSSGFATPSPASVPGSSSTPLGTCPSSESGVASAVLRVRQGKPLVSTDKLPKWARSPASPSSGPKSPAGSGDGQAKNQQQQQQQQPLFNRWFGGRQQPGKNKWLAAQQVRLGDACALLEPDGSVIWLAQGYFVLDTAKCCDCSCCAVQLQAASCRHALIVTGGGPCWCTLTKSCCLLSCRRMTVEMVPAGVSA